MPPATPAVPFLGAPALALPLLATSRLAMPVLALRPSLFTPCLRCHASPRHFLPVHAVPAVLAQPRPVFSCPVKPCLRCHPRSATPSRVGPSLVASCRACDAFPP